METKAEASKGALSGRKLEEIAFRKWVFVRRWANSVYWGLMCLYFLGFIVYPLVYPLIGSRMPAEVQVGPVTVSAATENSYLPFVIWLGVVYFVVLAFVGLWVVPAKLGSFSQRASLYAASCAIDALGRDPMLACFCVDKLLLALSDLLRQKSVRLACCSASAQRFMRIKPMSLKKSAVLRALERGKDTDGFRKQLQALSNGLRGDPSQGYVAANRFLIWLDGISRQQGQVSRAAPDQIQAVSEVPPEAAGTERAEGEVVVGKRVLPETLSLLLPQFGVVASAVLAFAGAVIVAAMKGPGAS